ncbi:hypothetical protein DRO97_01755 [Archaeoglobales archaeon]|nr:MAG: hypothetical protein DRO97_01755 [Archaeoglobales archaeon]
MIRWKDYHYVKKHKIWKVLPLAYWNTLDIWSYIKQNNLPVNKAYEKVDRVGCITCTGYIGWEKDMAKLYPSLYKKIATDLGRPPLTQFLED